MQGNVQGTVQSKQPEFRNNSLCFLGKYGKKLGEKNRVCNIKINFIVIYWPFYCFLFLLETDFRAFPQWRKKIFLNEHPNS